MTSEAWKMLQNAGARAISEHPRDSGNWPRIADDDLRPEKKLENFPRRVYPGKYHRHNAGVSETALVPMVRGPGQGKSLAGAHHAPACAMGQNQASMFPLWKKTRARLCPF